MVLVALSLLLVAFGGCGGDEAASYDTASAITTKIAEGGVECSDPQTIPQAQLVADGVLCGSGETTITAYIFEGEEQRDQWKAFGELTQESLVMGPNWMVSTPDAAIAEKVQEILDGELVE